MRIALPNELVDRVKIDVLPIIAKCLEEKQTDDQKRSSPIHAAVPFIYIDWQPRNENAYLFDLNFFSYVLIPVQRNCWR